MNTETLNKANDLSRQITRVNAVLNILDKGNAVDISFNNGGFSCCSNCSYFLTDEEVAEIKNNISNLIRERVQAQKDELEKEFNNL
ncbi:MAG: hypothetical protein K2N13_00940 [Paraprevotella sp.]|nr:hypothetical protein [Paraprevotella sp.]